MRKALLRTPYTYAILYALAIEVLVSTTVLANFRTPLVSLQVKDTPLIEVIAEVKKQTGWFFLYEQGLLDTKRITLTIKEAPIEKAMTEILRNQRLDFKLFENTVVIRSAEK